MAVVPRSYSASSSSSGFSPAHSIISLQNSSAASIFSEQTERELILLLKTLYAFETVSANRARSQSKPVIQLVQWKYVI